MHIWKKYLVVMNKLLFFFLLNFLFSDSTFCINKFYNQNKSFLNSQVLHLKAILDDNFNSPLSILINKKNRYKIEYNHKIIIADNYRIINYSPKEKQLFIDKPDTILNNLIFSISDSLSFKNFLKKNHFNYNNFKVFYSNDCYDVDSVLVNISNRLVKLNNVSIDTLKIQSLDSVFHLNIDENKVFKYDFR